MTGSRRSACGGGRKSTLTAAEQSSFDTALADLYTNETQNRGEEIRRRLADRDYRALFGDELATVIEQASMEQALAYEIGALRVVLARLLTDEGIEPTKLASSVARIATVSIQAARAQRSIGGGQADGIAESLANLLAEIQLG